MGGEAGRDGGRTIIVRTGVGNEAGTISSQGHIWRVCCFQYNVIPKVIHTGVGFGFGTKSREGRNRDGGEGRTITVSSLLFIFP